ncbi:hypothetical protein H0G86_003922 [Trichoderma simmonsii]|uniref:Ankyrin repeat protein n=1 Tax=Trichoderma simmonsii TaxID=1491479 RepID=A0A8G0L6K7_9HYPO|nr:hypothetical protein H0G86_003922 [Trichoderma simmonsii]
MSTHEVDEDIQLDSDHENDDAGGLQNQPSTANEVVTLEKSEEDKWHRRDLTDKCWDVMSILNKKLRRWDQSHGDPNTPILEEYKKIGLTERDYRDPKSSSVLHLLAKNTHNYASTEAEVLELVITYLLDHREKQEPQNRVHEIIQEEPILHVALEYGNDEFIKCIMKCRPEKFPDLLDLKDGREQNFIHRIFALPDEALRNGSVLNIKRKKTKELAISFVSEAKPETLAAKDKDGNLPIHYAMDYRQCSGRDSAYIGVLRNMVLKGDEKLNANNDFNNKNESPITYCTHADGPKPPQNVSNNEVTHSATKQLAMHPESGDRVPSIQESLRRTRNSSNTPDIPHSRRTDYINSTSAAASKAMVADPPEKRPKSTKDLDHSAQELMEILRLHYIRTRTDLVARDLIYGRDISDKNLYFDASGHKGADKIIDLIERMSFGGFCDTLAYVYIPIVEHSQDKKSTATPSKKSLSINQTMDYQKALLENPKVGRNSLVTVFDKLYDCGVRRILRLQVEDRDNPSHTDAAIEKALQGRDSLSAQPEKQFRGPISVETWYVISLYSIG